MYMGMYIIAHYGLIPKLQCEKFIPSGAGYTQQAHPREIPEAER
jgi:hypothetical protein